MDEHALRQLKFIAERDAVVGNVVGMPDVSLQSGILSGMVFASNDYVSPNAVGVDVGAGVTAIPVRGLYEDISPGVLNKIEGMIRSQVPIGNNFHVHTPTFVRNKLKKITRPSTPTKWFQSMWKVLRVGKRLCTLGGAGHFIEIHSDADGRLWIVVNSGTNGVGSDIYI